MNRKFNWCEVEFSAALGLQLAFNRLTSKDSKFRNFKFIIYKHGKCFTSTTVTPLGLNCEMRNNILERKLSPRDEIIALLHLSWHKFSE